MERTNGKDQREEPKRYRLGTKAHRYTESLRVRGPPALRIAIDVAADRHLMNASEYVRRAIVRQLLADGIDPAQFKETN